MWVCRWLLSAWQAVASATTCSTTAGQWSAFGKQNASKHQANTLGQACNKLINTLLGCPITPCLWQLQHAAFCQLTSSGAAPCKHLYSCCVRRAASAAACSSHRMRLLHVLLTSCSSSCSSSRRSVAAFSATVDVSSWRASLACFSCSHCACIPDANWSLCR